MARLAKLTARFLTDHGFSIGIQDVQPTPRLTVDKERLLKRGYEQCDLKIQQYDEGKLQPSPGCTPQQTLESEINGLLSKIRDDAGETKSLEELLAHPHAQMAKLSEECSEGDAVACLSVASVLKKDGFFRGRSFNAWR